jgi:hypothetical protein
MQMPIAVALVLIFVLYLIDKHKLWRLVFKLVVGLVALSVLGIGALFAWEKYQTYRDTKRQEAEAATEQAKLSACVSRLKQIPIPKDAVASEISGDILGACSLNADATGYEYNRIPPPPPPIKAISKPEPTVVESQQVKEQEEIIPSGWAVVKLSPSAGLFGTSIRRRCTFDVDHCGGFYLNDDVAKLRDGDRVQVLSEKVRTSAGDEIYEVKFQQWQGWISASYLKLGGTSEK